MSSEEPHVDLLSDYEIDFEDEDFDEDDEMALETVGGERVVGGGGGETKQQSTAQSELQITSAVIRPNTINLRGVNAMSTDDVKGYALAFFPDATPVPEWVDDESINLVYENEEIAAKALTAFSEDQRDENNNNKETARSTKPHALSKEHNLQARIANTLDRKVRNAKEYSRYYLLYGDPREEERRRRVALRRANRGPGPRSGEFYNVYNERSTARKDAVELFPAKKLSSMSKTKSNNNGDRVELFPEKVNPSVQVGLNRGPAQGSEPESIQQPRQQQSDGDDEKVPRSRSSTDRRRRRRSASPSSLKLPSDNRFGAGSSLAQLFGSRTGPPPPSQPHSPSSKSHGKAAPSSLGSKDKDGAARLQSIFAAASAAKSTSNNNSGGKKKRTQASDHFE